MYNGDGHKNRKKYTTTTKNKRLFEDIIRLLMELGYVPRYKIEDNCYRICWSHTDMHFHNTDCTYSKERYKGNVYNLTVADNHTVCVGENGKFMWTAQSLYGAFGNEYFHLFDINNAINITLGGQELIRFLAESFNNYFKNEFWKDLNYFDKVDPSNACLRDVVVAIETDSVIGSTDISMPKGNETIETLWNKSTDRWTRGTSEYGKLDNAIVYTVNSNKELEEKPIKHIMKHKVKKRLFEVIDEDGNSVTITEDHSIIVDRNGKLISVKPTEIVENDELITIIKNK